MSVSGKDCWEIMEKICEKRVCVQRKLCYHLVFFKDNFTPRKVCWGAQLCACSYHAWAFGIGIAKAFAIASKPIKQSA